MTPKMLVLLLINKILATEVEYDSNDLGPDYYRCPFCWEGIPVVYKLGSIVNKDTSMGNFAHEEDCIYKIAYQLAERALEITPEVFS